MINAGHSIVIQRGAGVKAAYIDSAYEQVGATITDDAYTGSQIILKVRAPKGDEIQSLRRIRLWLQCLTLTAIQNWTSLLLSKCLLFALELLPRTLSRAQNMDVLSSQANFGWL